MVPNVVFPLLHWDVFHLLGVPGDSTVDGIARRLQREPAAIEAVLADWSATGIVRLHPDGSWFCVAERFSCPPSLGAYIAGLYRQRIAMRWLSGDIVPNPRFAVLRLTQDNAEALRGRFEDVLTDAWRLATETEDTGDLCAFICYDFDFIGEPPDKSRRR